MTMTFAVSDPGQSGADLPHHRAQRPPHTQQGDEGSSLPTEPHVRAAPHVAPVAHIPDRLNKVLGAKHLRNTVTSPDDEILQAMGQPINFLDKFDTLGEPVLDKEELRVQMEEVGFARIPGMLHRKVAKEVRRYLLSLLGEPGVQWNPNEGDKPNGANSTLGRVLMGLPAKYYPPLERIMASEAMVRYMSHLMPCRHQEPGQKYRITQIFATVNDRIRWHVDYPNQPPFEGGKTTMYNPDFCQYKTIFYLQDHTQEDGGNPSALMVVPNTHKAEPKWMRCDHQTNCSIARKGLVPSSEYASVNLSPDIGDLLVMDARALHTAADVSLTLPKAPKATPRKHKYRVFLQFLFGLDNNKLTDAMQKKKDKNLVTRHFKQKRFP
eukprot:TRINITY_DN30053_c0_g1_i1.p1 TRINITY_DN30053_c0_g1~~TRINITY_DN30053_c0_g1_i1.p1  ORF type:complete len:428 (+),score=105.28 TRINITY_DN30053_c0_g1_i1:146-1285(+)